MSDFKILSERDHILKRPSMYVGSTSVEAHSGIYDAKYQTLSYVPALMKILNEIIDNSIDEFVRTDGKFADRIEIKIKENITGVDISVSDNGRGIPVKKEDEGYIPTLAWTRARAGSNFGDDADRTTIGMNGVGSFCTNVFSTEFVGISDDGEKHLTVRCVDNGVVKNESITKSKGKTGVTVKFSPDLSRFSGLSGFDEACMVVTRDRLKNLAVCYPGITFRFNGETIKYRSLKLLSKDYGESVVVNETENNKMIIAPAGDDQEFRLLSYVNGLHIKNGGSHVDYIVSGICDELRPLIKRKHKIEVPPAGIKQHLMLISYVSGFKNMKFDSQTKERITNPRSDVSSHIDVDFKKVAKQLMGVEEIITPIVETLLHKKEVAERLALARAQKKAKKTRVANHIAATSRASADKTLFIAEGLSAIGQLLNVRDPKTVGGYPLRGKVMNVRDMKPTDIIKNKELSELMSIIGLQLGQPVLDLNYEKIVLLTDADTDGDSIAGLLLNFFSNWQELFDNGNVYRCVTPLYICKKGKQMKWFYTKAEFDKFNSKGWEVEYFKGLGSLPKEVYKEVINNPKLVRYTAEQADYDSLEMAFGKDVQKRKEWLR